MEIFEIPPRPRLAKDRLSSVVYGCLAVLLLLELAAMFWLDLI